MPTYLSGDLGARLPPLRLVSRRTQEYAGACPHCGGDMRTSDRFHVWLTPVGRERYWCRQCGVKGLVQDLLANPATHAPSLQQQPVAPERHAGPTPLAAHIPRYRDVYTAVAAWAQANLWEACNPEPLRYLLQRGLTHATIERAQLGYALADPWSLRDYLERRHPDLLPYAEEAGVLVHNQTNTMRTHWNLCGCLVFPYRAQGAIVDLRTRTFPGKGYKSLPGSYTLRGASYPYGWDDIGTTDTVLITEGELKQLAVQQAYQEGMLMLSGLAHPGLTSFHRDWGRYLLQRGIHVAILSYDTQPRPIVDGVTKLAPEEIWTLRHGWTLARAGVQVLVFRLPVLPGVNKVDLDAFLLQYGPSALTTLFRTVVPLRDYHRRLPPNLLRAAQLLVPQRRTT
jgi:hypothetical protein